LLCAGSKLKLILNQVHGYDEYESKICKFIFQTNTKIRREEKENDVVQTNNPKKQRKNKQIIHYTSKTKKNPVSVMVMIVDPLHHAS
jgi:hypothetical protein